MLEQQKRMAEYRRNKVVRQWQSAAEHSLEMVRAFTRDGQRIRLNIH